MISLSTNEIDDLLANIENQKLSSNLGFFSKPFRIRQNDKEYIVKLYVPIKDKIFTAFILQNHADYIDALRNTGIKVPETLILTRPHKNKHQLIIIQEAFKDEELLRTLVQAASTEKVLEYLQLIFDDTLLYWKNKTPKLDIGFHPTLRNYSLANGSLFYFDTFPPMLMPQKQLNKLIIRMSPFGAWIKQLVPQKAINKVSNEYYFIVKMFTGIVGSTCRLRPNDAKHILAYSISYIQQAKVLTHQEKQDILNMLQQPPRLSGLWLFIRKISGNTGQPNIKY